MSFEDWYRQDRLPHIYCAGCGNGTIINCTLAAVDQMGWKKEETVFVSGIGCSSRAPGYILTDSLHTTHGRALAFATGVKMANPDLNVVVFTGDGGRPDRGHQGALALKGKTGPAARTGCGYSRRHVRGWRTHETQPAGDGPLTKEAQP